MNIKYKFPKPDQMDIYKFITHSLAYIDVDIDAKAIEEIVKTGEKDKNHYVSGHLSCFNYIYMNINKFNLFFDPNGVSDQEFKEKISWVNDIHKKLMTPIGQYNVKNMRAVGITESECGEFRKSNISIKGVMYPFPKNIIKNLRTLFSEVNGFKLKNGKDPYLYTGEDIDEISKFFYEWHIKFCNIKPFLDGNKRTARLIELVYRTSFYLPFRIIEFKKDSEYETDIKNNRTYFKEN